MGRREELAQAGYRLPASYFPKDAPASTPAAGGEIGEGFPAREHLIAAGLTTLEAVAAKTDEELDAISGIGPATVAEIRAALK